MATKTDALGSNISSLNSLLSLFQGKTTETTGGEETKQTMFSQEALNSLLKGLMEGNGSSPGLAAVASGQKAPGLYNSTSRGLMVNDFMTRAAGEVAKASAPTVTSKAKTTTAVKPPLSPSTGLLGGAALLALSPGLRKKAGEGIDSILGGVKEMFSGGVGGTGANTVYDYAASGANFASAADTYSTFEAMNGASDLAAAAADTYGTFEAMSGVSDFASAAWGAADAADAYSTFEGMSGAMDASAGFGVPYYTIANLGSQLLGYDGIGEVVGDAGEIISDVVQDVGDVFSGDTIICTELHAQGKMPSHIFTADQKFGKLQSADTLVGYHFWAKPLVSLMRRSQLATSIIAFFALPWAQHMAFKMGAVQEDNFFGKVLMVTFLPICTSIGKILRRNSSALQGA